MRAVVLSNDAMFRDGLICMMNGMPWCVSTGGEANFAPIERLIDEGEVDTVVVAIDSVDIGDLAALEASRKQHSFRVIAVASGDRLPAPMGSIADRVVNRSGGYEALRQNLRMVDERIPANLQIREPVAAYGMPRTLTPREREVARLVSQGMPNRRIASVLGIQEQSVKNLVSVVMRKLDCENRVQVALHLSSSNN